MKLLGRIDKYFPEKGYGWLHTEENGKVVKRFFHVTAVMSGTPVVGAAVSFHPKTSEKGYSAVEVEVFVGGDQ
jgi:cold shock CspA family protein